MKLKNLCFSLLLLCTLSGCFLAPIIEGVSEMGATPSDREKLLAKDIKKFNEALYWGNPGRALAYTDDVARMTVSDQIKARRDTERIVESKVSNMEFEPSSYKANVEIQVKYYKIPYYLVTERTEVQDWEFFVGSGWKLTGRKLG